MDNVDIQKLRDLPIVAVAERLGLRVSRRKSLCPFHQDHHASLSYSVSRNMYHCFVCGASGGPIDLVMHYLNKPFMDACRWLADEHNVILTEYKPKDTPQEAKPFDASRYERFLEHPWLSAEARRFLYDERRIDPRVAAWCRLTSWRDKQGVSWLQIPYYNQEGRLVGIQNRNLVKGALPRFRFPQGAECSIYNLPILKRLAPGNELWITEGCSDCWAMLSAGHKAIAIPSATLLNHKDVELLSTITHHLSPTFHMYPDHDEPGERLFMQLQKVLPTLVHHQLPQGCKDFGEYYLKLRVKN
jgi:DNA primase